MISFKKNKCLGFVVFFVFAAATWADSYSCSPKLNGRGLSPVGASFSFDLDTQSVNVTGRYFGQTRYAKLDEQDTATFSFDRNASAAVWKSVVDGIVTWVGVVYPASSSRSDMPPIGTSLFCTKK